MYQAVLDFDFQNLLLNSKHHLIKYVKLNKLSEVINSSKLKTNYFNAFPFDIIIKKEEEMTGRLYI